MKKVIYYYFSAVSYTHLRAHETRGNLVCRLLLEKKNEIIKNHQLFFPSIPDVLLNVFLAIAVDNISLEDEEEAVEAEEAVADAEHKEAIKEKYAPPSEK